MKIFKYLLGIHLILVFSIHFANAQNEDNKAIEMLSTFYAAHNKAWTDNVTPEKLLETLDSLQQKYCTKTLKDELKKQLQDSGLDHDIFTNDYGTDDLSMKTLKIEKDTKSAYDYNVTYSVNFTDPLGKPCIEKVKITLTVIIEDGKYKIKNVK